MIKFTSALIIILIYAVSISAQTNKFASLNQVLIPVKKNTITKSYTLKFLGIETIYNNHVGNEWHYYAKIGQNTLYQGDKIIVEISKGENLKIVSVLNETNEKYNDHSNVESSISYDDFERFMGSGFYVEVKITESNGRYAGNSAMMKFYYSIE